MKNIKCLIIDDESMARQGLEKYARQIDFLEVAGLCKNALQANTLLGELEINLLFLDIKMPKLSGMDFLKTLSKPPYVIFTTAYSEYALESFAFDVIDYLVKPISFERFLQSVNKANRLINNNVKSGEDDFFYVKESQKLVKIMVNEIVFIQSAQNYVNIVTTSSKHMVLIPLKSIQELLPNQGFLQIHRSCIIAVSKIEAIEGNQIITGEHKLQVSRRLRDSVFEMLLKNKIIQK